MTDRAAAFCVVGLPNRADYVPGGEVRHALETHHVFCGSARHYAIVQRYLPPGHCFSDVRGDVRRIVALERETGQPVCVLASGDPLFFGIAGPLRAAMPQAEIRVLAWFNSLQLLCHRAGLAYEHMTCVSVHGRGWQGLDASLIRGDRLIGVLTDAERTPAAIAARLRDYGFTETILHVGEALESPDERVGRYTLDDAAERVFDPLNCVIVEALGCRARPFGIPDAALARLPGRPDMMTKLPVRLTSLAQLDLNNRACLWDIGFCTGSLAVEARLHFPLLTVVAVERRPACGALLERNARSFGAPGITAIFGDFFEQDVATWPAPDAVFIGGHGGRLAEMLQRIDTRLCSGGRVVINAVLDSSRTAFETATAACGYGALEPIRLQVDAHNPIVVLAATKP